MGLSGCVAPELLMLCPPNLELIIMVLGAITRGLQLIPNKLDLSANICVLNVWIPCQGFRFMNCLRDVFDISANLCIFLVRSPHNNWMLSLYRLRSEEIANLVQLSFAWESMFGICCAACNDVMTSDFLAASCGSQSPSRFRKHYVKNWLKKKTGGAAQKQDMLMVAASSNINSCGGAFVREEDNQDQRKCHHALSPQQKKNSGLMVFTMHKWKGKEVSIMLENCDIVVCGFII